MDATLSKSEILESLKDLPENISLEELIDRFIFIEKVKKGLESSKNGHITSNDNVRKMVNSWSK